MCRYTFICNYACDDSLPSVDHHNTCLLQTLLCLLEHIPAVVGFVGLCFLQWLIRNGPHKGSDTKKNVIAVFIQWWFIMQWENRSKKCTNMNKLWQKLQLNCHGHFDVFISKSVFFFLATLHKNMRLPWRCTRVRLPFILYSPKESSNQCPQWNSPGPSERQNQAAHWLTLLQSSFPPLPSALSFSRPVRNILILCHLTILTFLRGLCAFVALDFLSLSLSALLIRR